MSDQLKHLKQLTDLAQETSSSARHKLLQDVTDLFMKEPDGLSEQEIAYFGDILVQLAREMESRVRQHLAETIADVNVAPRQLVTALAEDAIEVARPVLAGSPVLEDADLLSIIRKHSQDHMLAISERPAISDVVAGSLAEKGNDRVLGSLAGNPGADLSESTMGTILGRAEDKETIGKKLVKRADLSPEMAKRLFNSVSSAVLEHILAEVDSLTGDKLDGLVEEARGWFDEQYSDDEKVAAQQYVERKTKLGQLNTELLSTFVDRGEVWRLVAGLAQLTNVDFEVVRQSVFDSSGQKMAVLCKSIDMDRKAFEAVVAFTNFRKTRSQQDELALYGVYGALKPEPAQRALRFLRVRQKSTAKAAAG